MSILPSAAVAATNLILLSCGGGADLPEPDAIIADVVPNVVGVSDRGVDPSTVALTNGWGELCSGVLLASDVVLTAGHCVARAEVTVCGTGDRPALRAADPTSIHVYLGVPAPGAPWAAAGVAILTPDGAGICGGDLALVVLSSPVEGAAAALVSESGIAEGGHVRTVGFGWVPRDFGEVELLREHASVVAVSGTEFGVAEASCVAAGGAAAYDESTGEVVGILSRWGTACAAPEQFDVFTRADAYYGLVQQALAWGPSLAALADGGVFRDAGRKRDAGRSRKPPTDVGAACLAASDCGTGICVTALGSQYCSRTCAPDDHCPTHFKCVIAASGASVCVSS